MAQIEVYVNNVEEIYAGAPQQCICMLHNDDKEAVFAFKKLCEFAHICCPHCLSTISRSQYISIA